MVCKGAVPLFFMVSGALLLGKNESGKDLFQKRILRMILVIVIFSFLYYMKLVLKGERPFAPFSFLLSLPTDLVYLPYWFLYSYLGVLTILPILRPLAQNMSKNTFWYLIILQILLDCLKPTAWVLWGYGLCGYYNFSGLFQYVIFYPLIGYGLDQYFSETKFLTPKNIGRNLAVFVAAEICPMKNIIMEKGKPHPGDQCTMCYRCICNCPKQAITLLGSKVIEQYKFENYINLTKM